MNYLKLVEELNQEIYDKHGDLDKQFFFTANGFIDTIGFGSIMLWNSEDDDRVWIEECNDYEPMKPFIRKQLRQYGIMLKLMAS
tara:strand:- start:560 stop:811 length:252 start_codon:yes stop_codon:yes gene_type:complete